MHSHFKSEIAWLFFQLTRKNNIDSIKIIENRLSDTLILLKKYLNKSDEFLPYLKLFYRFIGFTRDSYKGIGEKTLSYAIICSFFHVFPTLGIYALYCLVKPSSTVASQYYFGCWKDMKQLCYYAYEHSSKGEKHPIIYYIIRLLNNQLSKDLETWKYSSHCLSKKHISNVAKYIPREKSKTRWLYDKLAIDWIEHKKPYILNSATNDDSYNKALLKSKYIYRKVVSFLNKCLDTTEIKLCEYNLSNNDLPVIDLNSVSILTAINKEPSFINIHDDSNNSNVASEYKQLILQQNWNLFDDNDDNKFVHGQSYSNISIYHIIKFAKQLYNTDENKLNNNDVAFVNKLWCYYLKKFTKTCKKQLIVPLIDVSYSMNDENFYTSIGIAILLSHVSEINMRIIAVDKLPTWINISSTTDIVCQVGIIMSAIENMHNTVPDFNGAIELIMNATGNMNKRINFTSEMKIVLISNFNNPNVDSSYVSHIFQKYNCLFEPTVVFWNMNNDDCINVPASIDNCKTMIYSGYSVSHIHNLCHLNTNYNKNMYDHICKILLNKHFDCFSDYVDKMISLF